MRNHIITIGLSAIFIFLGTMASSAMAQDVQTVEPDNGFLDQPKAVFMDALPVPVSLYPTFVQEVRAEDLQTHLTDTLEIGSPTYKNAHRLLVSNLRMLERQLSFNPVALARFNATTHPARSTIDQTIYTSDFPPYAPSMTLNASETAFVPTVVYDMPTRRSIIAAAEERNRLHVLTIN